LPDISIADEKCMFLAFYPLPGLPPKQGKELALWHGLKSLPKWEGFRVGYVCV